MNNPVGDEEKVLVGVPTQLFRALEQRARESDFASAEEYIVFVLGEIAREDEEMQDQTDLTVEEESKIVERLRGLGYIE